MKYKNRLAKLARRVKDWNMTKDNTGRGLQYHKPGSQRR